MMGSETVTLQYLEFYAGIGGWTLALEEACRRINKDGASPKIKTQCLAAFDHSEVCVQVWNHNFRRHYQDRPPENEEVSRKRQKKRRSTKTQIEIEKLSQKQLEEFSAPIWVMSPPCQPHTRQHQNQSKELQDPRSKSFVHLCQMIATLQWDALPSLIVLENVLGFGKSDSCKLWRESLLQRGYTISHFHLTPVQVGLPNQRPRYFSCAVLQNRKEITSSSPLSNYDSIVTSLSLESSMTNDRVASNDREPSISEIPSINTNITALGVKEENDVEEHELSPISSFLDDKCQMNDKLKVPDKLLKKNTAWCFDILTPFDRRSSCFTHGYGRYVKGAGSILYTGKATSIIHADQERGLNGNSKERVDDIIDEKAIMERLKLVSPELRQFKSNWADGLDLEGNLRYFSGTEMARIMGFPVDEKNSYDGSPRFSFPSDCPVRNQWRLLGNSLNIRVASKVTEVGLILLLSNHGTQNEQSKLNESAK